jgi:hypothetical protein
MDGEKKKEDPAKRGLKQNKKWSRFCWGESTFDPFQNAPETRPLDHKYLRKGFR